MNRLHEFKERYEHLCSELEKDDSEVEQEIIGLEQEIQDELDLAVGNGEEISLEREKVINGLQGLLRKVVNIKKDFDLYDEEGESDMMFPTKDDEDFDEESMSYDSVFGDE